MPIYKLTLLVALLFIPVAAAQEAPRVALRGTVVDRTNGGPVLGAQVYVTDRSGVQRVAITDLAGHYAIEVAPGAYEVAFVFGESRTQRQVSVEPGQPAVADGKVDSSSGEIIIIQEKRRPKVVPKPTNYSPHRAPPYSDEALEKDAWTRAWMVLEIGPTGEVSRFKFLKRPGYDLEKIAASEVFALRFEPGRDETGRAVRTWMVWGIEWPSNGWLIAHGLPRTKLPPLESTRFGERRSSDGVPCKGSGPMLLYSLYPTYRDCSKPDLARMPHEPWIVRS